MTYLGLTAVAVRLKFTLGMGALSIDENMSSLFAEFASYLFNERRRAPSTVQRYRRTIERLAVFLEGRGVGGLLGSLDVDRDHLAAFASSQEASDSVFNERVFALRAFYAYLGRGLANAANPAMKVAIVKRHERERLPLDFGEWISLLDAVETAPEGLRSRNAAVVTVALFTGLRVSELISLNMAQLDLRNRMILDIRRKGGKSLSTPMSDLVVVAIERYLPDRMHLLRGINTEALFISTRGRRLSVRSLQRLVTEYGKKAGISRPVSPHVLRHSAATELLEVAGLRTAQELLGHSKVTTTQRYAHVRHRSLRAAVDKLGERYKRQSRRTRSDEKDVV